MLSYHVYGLRGVFWWLCVCFIWLDMTTPPWCREKVMVYNKKLLDHHGASPIDARSHKASPAGVPSSQGIAGFNTRCKSLEVFTGHLYRASPAAAQSLDGITCWCIYASLEPQLYRKLSRELPRLFLSVAAAEIDWSAVFLVIRGRADKGKWCWSLRCAATCALI